MKLSIVTTLYNSSLHINEFCQRAKSAAQHMVDHNYEIILVNDGSPDDSLQLALNQIEINPNIVIIDLSRNFGHHKALMTGLKHAQGEYVFLIDSDLEEEPEWLIPFFKQMAIEKCDVVYGVQKKRKGGVFERITGEWFYRIFRLLTDINLPSNLIITRIMTRQYVQALLQHEEREVFIPGLWHITGFKQHPQFVKKHCTSETTYTLRRKIALFVNAITSFSNAPLVSIFYVGIIILVFSGASTGFLIINRFLFHSILSGWTSIMASIWLLGGLIISFIGIIGIYLSKVFSEIKRRPYTIVRQIYKKNPLVLDEANRLLKITKTAIPE